MVSSASYVVKFISEVEAILNEANCDNHDDQMTNEDNARQRGPTYLTMDQATVRPEISHIHQIIPFQKFSAKWGKKEKKRRKKKAL